MSSQETASRRGSTPAAADSQTAQEYIASQLQLEAEAKEILPYQFDRCTAPLGPLRQTLFSCLTCNPPETDSTKTYRPAGVCYSCSISCHGEHELVELFSKRNFTCDCGSSRLPDTSKCTLQTSDPVPDHTVRGREANKYNHNYEGKFCVCGEQYDPATEKGTMYQCLGLATVEHGGCGEDWYHPECLMGLPKTEPVVLKEEGKEESQEKESEQQPEWEAPAGFPEDDDFDHMICFKCVDTAPWIKSYTGTQGFVKGIPRTAAASPAKASLKRKLSESDDTESQDIKRAKVDEQAATEDEPQAESSAPVQASTDKPKHESLPIPTKDQISIFVKEDFRDQFCRCAKCYPRLAKYPQLLEEEECHEPPVSESGQSDDSQNSVRTTQSLLERGEAALSTMDRTRAIEGVMAYNDLRGKLKTFLAPFAQSGESVSAEDVRAYFARLKEEAAQPT